MWTKVDNGGGIWWYVDVYICSRAVTHTHNRFMALLDSVPKYSECQWSLVNQAFVVGDENGAVVYFSC